MRVCKKIFSAFISLALSFLVVMAGIFPAGLPVSAEETSKSVYEQTNVLDDLKKATVNGEPFNLTNYNFDESKPTQVLSFVEYCYSFYTEKQDNFGLYVYVYNPKGLKFKYEVKGNEIFVNRMKKSITRSTVVLAYQNMRQAEEIRRAKELGTFGASYLYPVFLRLGIK